MNKPLGSGPKFASASNEFRYLIGMAVGSLGGIGVFIQIVLFPLIDRPFNYQAAIVSLSAALGVPIAKLFQHSQKEEE